MRITLNNLIQASYITVPKVLFYGKYRDIDNNCRILYSILLDLLGLSQEKDWSNNSGELFVRSRQVNLAFRLGINRGTLIKCLEKLEAVGLIDRVRNGKTIPDDIYPHIAEDIIATDEDIKQLTIEKELEQFTTFGDL